VWSLVWSLWLHQHFCRSGMLAVGDKVLMGLIAADVQPPQTLTANPILDT